MKAAPCDTCDFGDKLGANSLIVAIVAKVAGVSIGAGIIER